MKTQIPAQTRQSNETTTSHTAGATNEASQGRPEFADMRPQAASQDKQAVMMQGSIRTTQLKAHAALMQLQSGSRTTGLPSSIVQRVDGQEVADRAAALRARLTAPIAQRLREVLAQQEGALQGDIDRMPDNTTDMRSYQNLLMDLTSEQIDEAIENAEGDPFILKSYLADTLDYSSCFPAAERLLSLLGVAGSPKEQTGGQGPVIHGSAQQGVLMTGLTQAMQAAANAGDPTIFRIGLAGHGFVLVVRLGRVEHLEAVAHAADLMTSLESGTTYTMADIVQHLTDMVAADEGTRTDGATSMGWNAAPLGLLDRDEAPHDWLLKYYGLTWKSQPLATMPVILDRVVARIRANRAAVMRGLGL